MDFLVTNARVIDQVSKEESKASVAVVDDRIIDISHEDSSLIPLDKFDRVIDAQGKFLLPGFFDIHSRADLSLISDPLRLSAISQGILVEVIGQDGLGVAPISTKNYLAHYQYVNSSLGNSQLEWRWQSVFNYLDKLNNKTSSNVIFYAPYGTMRLEASLNPKLSLEGESALVYILERAMDEGAVGLSISTNQVPAVLGWLDTNELIPLLKVLHKKKGILSVDVQGSKNILKDIEKAVLLAKNHGLKLHISRLSVQKEVELDKIFNYLEKSKKDLLSILIDSSPYTGRLLRFIDFLPSNLRNLSSEELRIKLRRPETLEKSFNNSEIAVEDIESARLVTTSRRDMKRHEGSRLIDIALELDESVYQTLLKFLEFDSEETFLEYQATSDDVLKKIFAQNYVLPASTGCVKGRMVPEMFSSIPMYFNNFANMDVFDLVQRLCDLPSSFYAVKWGVARNILANFILIDPQNFNYSFDYNSPGELAKGIEMAVVNGKIILEKNKLSSLRSGRVLSWF